MIISLTFKMDILQLHLLIIIKKTILFIIKDTFLNNNNNNKTSILMKLNKIIYSILVTDNVVLLVVKKVTRVVTILAITQIANKMTQFILEKKKESIFTSENLHLLYQMVAEDQSISKMYTWRLNIKK